MLTDKSEYRRMRDEWESVRKAARHEPLSKEERLELKQIMQSKVFKRACSLVYENIARQSLAKLVDHDAKIIAEFNRSPDIVFGQLLEMCDGE
jgi:hypothetical protein